MKHRIHPDAEAEYEAALSWYFARSERAAAAFETEFDRAIASIVSNPLLYPILDGIHRFCVLHRFPYCVIYRQDGKNEVQVVAVAHARRSPGYWLNRD